MLANSYGLVGKTKSSMRAMVSKLMESIYPKEILNNYTISEYLPRISRNVGDSSNLINTRAKTALPAKDVDSITGMHWISGRFHFLISICLFVFIYSLRCEFLAWAPQAWVGTCWHSSCHCWNIVYNDVLKVQQIVSGSCHNNSKNGSYWKSSTAIQSTYLLNLSFYLFIYWFSLKSVNTSSRLKYLLLPTIQKILNEMHFVRKI